MMLLLIFLDAEDNGRSSWLKSKKKSSQSARGGGDFFFRVATKKIKRNWIGRGFGIDCSSDVANSYFSSGDLPIIGTLLRRIMI